MISKPHGSCSSVGQLTTVMFITTTEHIVWHLGSDLLTPPGDLIPYWGSDEQTIPTPPSRRTQDEQQLGLTA